jgi:hypothetical protein
MRGRSAEVRGFGSSGAASWSDRYELKLLSGSWQIASVENIMVGDSFGEVLDAEK